LVPTGGGVATAGAVGTGLREFFQVSQPARRERLRMAETTALTEGQAIRLPNLVAPARVA
jgi:hypothetical protein